MLLRAKKDDWIDFAWTCEMVQKEFQHAAATHLRISHGHEKWEYLMQNV